MRKVVLYHIVSLDGVALVDDSDWFDDGGPEMFANLGRVIGSQDDVLLGRVTYEYWADTWPESDLEPFASFINGTRKHVFTSTTPTQAWANTTVVSTSLTDYVKAMRQQTGGDIGIHGSIDLSRTLLRAKLVDELQLVVASSVAGNGRRVFDDDTRQPLELLDVQRSPKGTLFLGYRCTSAVGAT